MAHKENDPGNVAMIDRMITAAGRRLAGYDPDQLARLDALHDTIEAAKAEAVAGMRDAGITWATIGAALGVTKEAVVQRYGPQSRLSKPA